MPTTAGESAKLCSFGVSGLHHFTLRVNDMARSRAFYSDVLRFEVEEPPLTDSIRYRFTAGDTIVVLRPALPDTPADDRFSESRIGVDHLAFRVGRHEDLVDLVTALGAAGVPTQGIQSHPWLPSEFVCFRDPDNVQWEFYRDIPTTDGITVGPADRSLAP